MSELTGTLFDQLSQQLQKELTRELQKSVGFHRQSLRKRKLDELMNRPNEVSEVREVSGDMERSDRM